MKPYLLSFDCGTETIRAAIYNQNADLVFSSQSAIRLFFRDEHCIEQDPMEIWAIQISLAKLVLEQSGISPEEIAAIGIANQRETVLMWDGDTGRPLSPALSWQDQRSNSLCQEWNKLEGFSEYVRKNTGLRIHSYFSAPKIRHYLDQEAELQSSKKNIKIGTIDSWLVWNLTRGDQHITDHTNASRTMLMNINSFQWDDELLGKTRIPLSYLPQVCSSSEVIGETHPSLFPPCSIPIAGIIADQQASLLGNCCFNKGSTKNTYGSGAFMLMNTGHDFFVPSYGSISTVAWTRGTEKYYALDCPIFVSGRAIQWMQNNLHIIHDTQDSAYYSSRVEDSGGVYVVPAFIGMGAPYWDTKARGIIVGLNNQSNVYHIVRATLESLGYRSRDALEALEKDAMMKVGELRVDGGASYNDMLLQFQADTLGIPITRTKHPEVTLRGAAFAAGLGIGMWKDFNELQKFYEVEKSFHPSVKDKRRSELYGGWQKAVRAAISYGKSL